MDLVKKKGLYCMVVEPLNGDTATMGKPHFIVSSLADTPKLCRERAAVLAGSYAGKIHRMAKVMILECKA